MQFIFKHKTSIRKVSNIFGANLKMNSAFQMLKSLHRVDWAREPSKQELVDIFYCFISRTYGKQFLKVADIPEELCVKIPAGGAKDSASGSDDSEKSSKSADSVGTR